MLAETRIAIGILGTFIILGAFIIFFGLEMNTQSEACKAAGGVYVRTASGYACVEPLKGWDNGNH